MAERAWVAVRGSERRAVTGAQAVGPAHPQQRVDVSVVVRPRNPLPRAERGMTYFSREEFAQRHGAVEADIDKVREFAREFGLTVLEHPQQAARRIVMLSGTVKQLEQAFGVELKEYHCEQFSYRGREGTVQVPQELAEIVQAVVGLDDRPQAKTHYRWREAPGTRKPSAAAGTSYTPVQVAQLYKFPTDVNGAGETVGIIELGGGYRPADIQNYLKGLGLTAPAVTSVSVDGGKNSPGDPNGPDGEVMLDIEV